jgi:hypothetical protein
MLRCDLLRGAGAPTPAARRAALLAVLLLCTAGGCGRDAAPGGPGADDLPAQGAGRWLGGGDADPPSGVEARTAELESIGYLAGSRRARAPGGVHVLDAARVQPGLNLVVSGHAPEALLVSNDGRLLHRWTIPCRRAFPGVPPGDQPRFLYFRRARLLPNGDLLAIFEGTGIVRLRADSSLVWAWPGHAHHDLDVRPDGRIITLARDVRLVPRIDPVNPILVESVVELSPDGVEMRRVPLLEALEATEGVEAADARVKAVLAETRGDVLHANTARLVGQACGGPLAPAQAGDVLISLRSLGLVGVLDFEAGRLRWLRTGDWYGQHQPQLLPDGHVLLFDNGGGGAGRSRALEFNPETDELTWQWSGTAEDPLWSATCGSVQRLPSGDTLIVESDGGRALTVAPDGHVVWRFDSPWRTGADDELVATLFDVERLPDDFPLTWMR